jgi:hypothetical protein
MYNKQSVPLHYGISYKGRDSKILKLAWQS